MTLTIVNHCQDGTKKSHRTYIMFGKPNGIEKVLQDHDYSPFIFCHDDLHNKGVPDGSPASKPSCVKDGSEVNPIPSIDLSSKRGPSGFFQEEE